MWFIQEVGLFWIGKFASQAFKNVFSSQKQYSLINLDPTFIYHFIRNESTNLTSLETKFLCMIGNRLSLIETNRHAANIVKKKTNYICCSWANYIKPNIYIYLGYYNIVSFRRIKGICQILHQRIFWEMQHTTTKQYKLNAKLGC